MYETNNPHSFADLLRHHLRTHVHIWCMSCGRDGVAEANDEDAFLGLGWVLTPEEFPYDGNAYFYCPICAETTL